MSGELVNPKRRDPLKDNRRLGLVVESIGPPPEHVRGEGLSAELKSWVIRFLYTVPSPQRAADIIGCSPKTLQYHKSVDAEFRAEWEQAMASSREHLVGIAHERAMGFGTNYLQTPEGELVGESAPLSEKLMEVLLKFHLGEKHIVEGQLQAPPGSLTLVVTPEQLAKLSRDERRTLTELLRKIESFAPKTLEHQQA